MKIFLLYLCLLLDILFFYSCDPVPLINKDFPVVFVPLLGWDCGGFKAKIIVIHFDFCFFFINFAKIMRFHEIPETSRSRIQQLDPDPIRLVGRNED